MPKTYKFTVDNQEIETAVDGGQGLPLLIIGIEGLDTQFLRSLNIGAPPPFDIITVKQPYYGNINQKKFKNLEDFSEFYYKVIQKLTEEDPKYKKVCVYAPSAHGIVAISLAKYHPENVSGLVTFGTPLGNPMLFQWEALLNFLLQHDPKWLFENLASDKKSEEMKDMLAKFLPENTPEYIKKSCNEKLGKLRIIIEAKAKTKPGTQKSCFQFFCEQDGKMPYDELDGVKRSVRMREVISARQLSASSSMLDKLNCTAAGRQVNDTSLTSASVPPAQEFNSHLIEFLFKSIWEYFSKTEYSTVIDLIMKVGELKQFPIVVCHGIGDGQVPIPTAEQIFTLEHAGIKYHLFENAYHVPHDVAKEFFKLLQEELCSPNVSKTLATSSVF